MNDLSKSARALIDAAAAADAVDAAAQERVRRQLVETLASPHPLLRLTPSGAAGTRAWLATHVLAPGAAVVVAVAGGIWVKQVIPPRSAPPAVPTLAEPLPTSRAAPLPPASLPTLAPDWPKTPEAPPPHRSPSRVHHVTAAPVASAIPPEPALPAPEPLPPAPRDPPGPGTLPEELDLLERAQRASRAGEVTQALQLLEEDARRFPDGVLVEERLVAHALALCAAGRTAEAQEDARSLARRFPRSAQLARLRSSCARDSQ
jgi:hypothetical protein